MRCPLPAPPSRRVAPCAAEVCPQSPAYPTAAILEQPCHAPARVDETPSTRSIPTKASANVAFRTWNFIGHCDRCNRNVHGLLFCLRRRHVYGLDGSFDLYRLRRRHVFGVVQTTNVCTNCEAGKYSSTGVSVWWWRTGFTGGWASATRVPQAVLTRVPQAVFAGSRVTLVVTEAGKLWAWGQGAQGRLGLNEGKAGWCRRAWNRSTLPTHPSPPLPLAAPTREAKLSAHDCTMLRT